MKGILIALLTLICTASVANAQEALLKNSSWRDSAEYYIKNLDALVVRLRTKSVAIEKLRAGGDETEARHIEKIQREENTEIIQAFRKEFDFCKVYFMFADSSDALLQGKRSDLFLDDSLRVSSAIELKENVFLIADKGNAKLYTNSEPSQPDAEETERGYLNEAIVIFDRNFRQLRDPFPYYAQEVFPGNLLSTNWNGKVKTLNSKFHKYKERVSQY